MNVSNVLSNFIPQQATATKLTYEQSVKIQDILAQYDSDKLSAQDASEIVSQISDLGVKPSRALAQELDAVGFNAKAIGDAARAAAGSNLPATALANPDDATFDTLAAILGEYDLENLSEDDRTAITSALRDVGVNFSSSNAVVDIVA